MVLALESPAGTVVDLPRQTFHDNPAGAEPPFTAGTPSHLPRGILAAAYSDESLLTVRHNLDGAERLLLDRGNLAGETLSTRALDLPPELDARALAGAAWADAPVLLAAHGGWTLVGIGDLVLRGSEESGWGSDSHGGRRVTGFAKTARHARPGFAVTLARGVRLIWPGVREQHDEELDVPGERPLAAFTGGGLLVTAGGGRGQVWDVAGGRGSRLVGDFPAPDDLCAVTAGQEPRDFHLFSADGTVRPFRVG